MVGFILAEGPGRGFPAEDVDAVFDDGGCDPAPGRRKVSLARPPIGCGVVFLGDAEVLAVLAVQPATDRVEAAVERSGEHTSELQSRLHLVCRLLLLKKKKKQTIEDAHAGRV